MLKWFSNSTTSSRNDNNDEQVPSFPMPGSIQRAGATTRNTSNEEQRQPDSSEDDDDDDDANDAIANMELHISPPSPVAGSSSKNINATTLTSITINEPTENNNTPFKAPSFSLTPSQPSTSTSSAPIKPKPKPSHRPFPPEPVQTLNNGRVTFASGVASTLGSSLNLPPSTTIKPKKQRFVALQPGFSPLDWARLNKEGDDYELRCGFDKPQKFTIQEVSEHATPNDAWSIFNGRVYNITPYLHFHPGGVKELMRVAGKDGTELFMKTHAWVNAELMMEGCLIGFLVRE